VAIVKNAGRGRGSKGGDRPFGYLEGISQTVEYYSLQVGKEDHGKGTLEKKYLGGAANRRGGLRGCKMGGKPRNRRLNKVRFFFGGERAISPGSGKTEKGGKFFFGQKNQNGEPVKWKGGRKIEKSCFNNDRARCMDVEVPKKGDWVHKK